jgi:hypothetical protein
MAINETRCQVPSKQEAERLRHLLLDLNKILPIMYQIVNYNND